MAGAFRNSVIPDYKLIKTINSGATNEIIFDNLTGNKMYFLTITGASLNGVPVFSIEINNSTTATNYYTQIFKADNTTITAARNNNNNLGQAILGNLYYLELRLSTTKLTSGNRAVYSGTYLNRLNSNMYSEQINGAETATTIENITKIRIANNGAGAWSGIAQLYEIRSG